MASKTSYFRRQILDILLHLMAIHINLFITCTCIFTNLFSLPSGNLDLVDGDGTQVGVNQAASTMHWGPFFSLNSYYLTTGHQ